MQFVTVMKAHLRRVINESCVKPKAKRAGRYSKAHKFCVLGFNFLFNKHAASKVHSFICLSFFYNFFFISLCW